MDLQGVVFPPALETLELVSLRAIFVVMFWHAFAAGRAGLALVARKFCACFCGCVRLGCVKLLTQ